MAKARGRSLTRNPTTAARPASSSPAVKKASAVWKLFHKKDKPRELIQVNAPWPTKWEYAGEAVTTYYDSDKWSKDGEFTKYFHDHEGGKIKIWHPAGMVPWTSRAVRNPAPPAPEAAAVLGFSLGVDVKRHDTGEMQHVSFERGAYLVAAPDKKHLWVVEPSKGVVAMIAGHGLVVEARGIVG
jgi:hypothetical protein